MKIKSMFLSALVLSVVTVGSVDAQTQKPTRNSSAVESKGEERLEHEAFKTARQQSQRLVKGIKLTADQRSRFEDLRKRYDTQYKALEKEERDLDKTKGSDMDVLRRLEVARLQERAEIRAMLTPRQQVVFDRNVAAPSKKMKKNGGR